NPAADDKSQEVATTTDVPRNGQSESHQARQPGPEDTTEKIDQAKIAPSPGNQNNPHDQPTRRIQVPAGGLSPGKGGGPPQGQNRPQPGGPGPNQPGPHNQTTPNQLAPKQPGQNQPGPKQAPGANGQPPNRKNNGR